MRILAFPLITLLAFCPVSFAGDVSSSLRAAIQPFIEDGEISGAVTLVARDGNVVSHEAIGCRI